MWRGDNFSPNPTQYLRATPIYVNGTLYSVAGTRRTAVAIDPATGETLWTFREPHTKRWRTRCGRTTARASPTPRWTAAA